MPSLADLTHRLKPVFPSRSLPPLIVMTDAERLADPCAVVRRLPRGSAVILRHYETPHRDRRFLARRLAGICRSGGIRLLIAADAALAVEVGADGIHLPEGILVHGRNTWRRWRRRGWLVTAAAHSPKAARIAAGHGVDAVLLAPVFATASHPRAQPLGPLLFAAWTRKSPLPVYALGGVNLRTAPRLAASGAVGFAGIGWIDD